MGVHPSSLTVASFITALAVVLGITGSTPAYAAGEIDNFDVTVPTEIPCTLMPDGTVVTPTNLSIANNETGIDVIVDTSLADDMGNQVDFSLDVNGRRVLTRIHGTTTSERVEISHTQKADISLNVSPLNRRNHAQLIDMAKDDKTSMFKLKFYIVNKALGGLDEDCQEGVVIYPAYDTSEYSMQPITPVIFDSTNESKITGIRGESIRVANPDDPVRLATEKDFDLFWGDSEGEIESIREDYLPTLRSTLKGEKGSEVPYCLDDAWMGDMAMAYVSEWVAAHSPSGARNPEFSLSAEDLFYQPLAPEPNSIPSAFAVDVTPVLLDEDVDYAKYLDENGKLSVTLKVPTLCYATQSNVLITYFDRYVGAWRVDYPLEVDSLNGIIIYEVDPNSMFDTSVLKEPTFTGTVKVSPQAERAENKQSTTIHVNYEYAPSDAIADAVRWEIADDAKGTNAREVALSGSILQEAVWGKYLRVTIADTSGKYQGTIDSDWVGPMMTEFYGLAKFNSIPAVRPPEGPQLSYSVTGPILIDNQSDLSCYDIHWEIADDAKGTNARPHDMLNTGGNLVDADITKYLRFIVSARTPYSTFVTGSIASPWKVIIRDTIVHNPSPLSSTSEEEMIGGVIISLSGEVIGDE